MGQQARILIADDNLQIRMLVKAALRTLGAELLESIDGEQTLETAIKEHPDLILLDVMMPKLDGFEVLAFLRKRPETQHIPVVMLTTAGSRADLAKGEELGAEEYVVKPFEPKMLRELVERTIAGTA